MHCPRARAASLLVALAFAAVACGGEIESKANRALDGGDAAVADASADADANAPVPACPADTAYFDLCKQATTCIYTLTCTGGSEKALLECDGGAVGQVFFGSCDRPYEACEDDTVCVSGEWQAPHPSDPPPPCPSHAPADGTPCLGSFPGGYGGPCGYPCDAGWSVATCVPSDDAGDRIWINGSCAPL